MMQTLITTFKLETSMSVNAFLFYFKRIPLIGKIFSDKIYHEIGLKSAITVLVFILKLLSDIFMKTIYVGLSLFLPVFIFYNGESTSAQLGAFTHSLFIMTCLILPLFFCETLDFSKSKMIAVGILRMPANKYFVFHIFYTTFRNVFLLFPSICIFTILAKGDFIHAIYFTLLITFFRFIGEAANLLLFTKTKQIIRKHIILHVILLLLFLAANYLPIILHLTTPTKMILFSLPFIAFTLLASVYSLLYILKYKYYSTVYHAANKPEDLSKDKKKLMREASFSDVKLKDKDLASSLQHQETYNHKHGYDYLNALFFQRHRRMLFKPMYISLAFIGLFFCAGVLAFLFIEDFSMLYIKGLSKGFPSLVFVMYMLSLFLCQRATKAMFYNCDISLLRYSYYRKKPVILANFRIRLRKVLAINGVPAIAIAATLLGLGLLASPNEIAKIIPIVILVLILSVFFSVHHLFMYYVFQPYTTDLDVKNPLFKLINGIVYLASYLCLQIHQAPSAFVIIILTITILYTITALILILRLAPKTFRVK